MISPELIKAIIGAGKSCGAGLATIGLTSAGVGVGLVFASLVFISGRVPSEAKNVFKMSMLIKKFIINKTIIFVLLIALVIGLDNDIRDRKKNNFINNFIKLLVVIIVILLTLVVFIYIHALIEQQQQIFIMLEHYKSLLDQEIDKVENIKKELLAKQVNNVENITLEKKDNINDRRWLYHIIIGVIVVGIFYILFKKGPDDIPPPPTIPIPTPPALPGPSDLAPIIENINNILPTPTPPALPGPSDLAPIIENINNILPTPTPPALPGPSDLAPIIENINNILPTPTPPALPGPSDLAPIIENINNILPTPTPPALPGPSDLAPIIENITNILPTPPSIPMATELAPLMENVTNILSNDLAVPVAVVGASVGIKLVSAVADMMEIAAGATVSANSVAETVAPVEIAIASKTTNVDTGTTTVFAEKVAETVATEAKLKRLPKGIADYGYLKETQEYFQMVEFLVANYYDLLDWMTYKDFGKIKILINECKQKFPNLYGDMFNVYMTYINHGIENNHLKMNAEEYNKLFKQSSTWTKRLGDIGGISRFPPVNYLKK